MRAFIGWTVGILTLPIVAVLLAVFAIVMTAVDYFRGKE